MLRRLAMAIMLASGLALVAGCGGASKATKAPAAPAPECQTDQDCAAKGACMKCTDGACGPVAGCCTSDTDCSSHQRCVKKPGAAYALCE